MSKYAIFNSEGLVEGQFYDAVAALDAANRYQDEHLYVSEVCVSHPDQPYDECEGCDD